jgi:hypothetical protein
VHLEPRVLVAWVLARWCRAVLPEHAAFSASNDSSSVEHHDNLTTAAAA